MSLVFSWDIDAAPLPAMEPIELVGTISKVEWTEQRQVQGIVGMSGSAGQTRSFPAHFTVMLTDWVGVDSATARNVTQLLDWHALDKYPEDIAPPFVILQINDARRDHLRDGMRIHISGYVVRGDEGGTWTSYEQLTVLEH